MLSARRAGSSTRSSGHLHHAQRICPLGQQLRLARLGVLQMLVLDVAVAADVLGDAGDLGRQPDVARVERGEQAVDGAQVVLDQAALGPAFGGVAEYVEYAAAQPAQDRKSTRLNSSHVKIS